MTYGKISKMIGDCTARMVGYAASSIPLDSDIPWQRVINYKGGISLRSSVSAELIQQKLLEAEGVTFDKSGRTGLGYFIEMASNSWNSFTKLLTKTQDYTEMNFQVF